MKNKKFFAISCGVISLTFSACVGGPTYSALPKSTLDSGVVVDGSAIAFQGKAPGCASLMMRFAPELEPGKYGKLESISLGWTKFGIPVKWGFHGDGKTLHRYELPVGRYAIAGFSCLNSASELYTPSDKAIKYGEFDVVAGKTTYIGNMTIGANARWRRFNFDVSDDSEKAKADFAKKYPDKVNDFQIHLIENVYDRGKALEELIKAIKKQKAKS